MGTLMRFAEESWPALSCRESSVRLSCRSLGPTADDTGKETANGKLGMQIKGCRSRDAHLGMRI